MRHRTAAEGMDVLELGIPVTIITGFLGSGKTTLLNHILTNQQGLKTAVLVNEFGEIGIDNELVVATDANMIELNNGCVCCTINEDLVDAVYSILERPQTFDYLIVETTGLADPLPVAQTFSGTKLREVTRLDSIVTLIDCSNYSVDLFASQAAYSQIASGDVLILNKMDLVNEATVDSIAAKVNDIKQGARILRARNSQVPLPLILSVGLFDSDRYFAQGKRTANKDRHRQDDHEHDCDYLHHQLNHLENDGFTSVSFQSDEPFSLLKFQQFLDELSADVFRAKGIVWFSESPQRHVFHLVGKRFTLEHSEWHGQKHIQLVLIGQNLDRAKLYYQIRNCAAS